MADTLSNVFNVVDIARKVGHTSCVISPSSKLIVGLLKIMKESGYVDNYELINDARGGFIKVDINESINKCKAIRPRFPIKASEITKFEKRFLPALNFGVIIMSTNKGLMTNDEAKKMNIGGVPLAYVY